MPGHVDQGRHRAGQDALWDEVGRLRLLLGRGVELVEYLECRGQPIPADIHAAVAEWSAKAREELGT